MRIWMALLAAASLSLAADNPSARLRTLSGKTVEGELVRLSEKEIVLRGKTGDEATPLAEVLELDLQPATLPPAGTKYIDIELVDGSLLHCGQLVLRNQTVEVKLVLGQEIKLPLASVTYILNDAHDAAVRDKWKAIVAKQEERDLIAVRKGMNFSALDGTLGEGDDKGETIGFEAKATNTKLRVRLDRIQGMSFLRKLDPNRPEPICKVFDNARNLFVVSKIEPSVGGYVLTTSTGAKIECPTTTLAKLDFSKGKLTYLSDLDPVKVVESSALEGVDHYRRDKNLDGGAIRLGGKVYSKGLSIPATTELIYNIGGEYKEFKAMLGFDDQVGGDSNVKVLVEGDGRELYKGALKRSDKKMLPIAVTVKDVKQLRIVVGSVNVLDLGDHLELGDAKVSK